MTEHRDAFNILREDFDESIRKAGELIKKQKKTTLVVIGYGRSFGKNKIIESLKKEQKP